MCICRVNAKQIVGLNNSNKHNNSNHRRIITYVDLDEPAQSCGILTKLSAFLIYFLSVTSFVPFTWQSHCS